MQNKKIIILLILFSLTSIFSINKKNITSLGKRINSQYQELSPVLSPDGTTLYFCREGSPLNVGYKYRKDDQDIWVSYFKNGQWTQAQHINAPFNSYGYDFPIGTSVDGKTLYLGNTYFKDGKIGHGVSKTHFEKGSWTFPENQEIEDYYNEATLVNYSMGTDEKTLILNVQRKDTYGKMDLYVSFLTTENKWSVPMNLGPQINSKYKEVTPYIANDMKTLYFSSNRPGGEGRYDMYVSRRLDDTWKNWSKPVNLGPTVNTKGNDISYVIKPDGKTAIFASETRVSRRRRIKNLYYVTLPEAFRPERSLIIHGYTKTVDSRPISAMVKYERLSDGQLLGIAKSDSTTGAFKISLPLGEDYGLRAEKENYLPESIRINLKEQKSIKSKNVILKLAKIEKGSKIRLNNVFFAYRKSTLAKTKQVELLRLVKLLKSRPNLIIEIGGHTDNIGSNRYNQRLSLKRAISVKKFFLKNKVSSKQIKARGYGESKPIASNKTKQGRKQNRRVEFKIIGI